MTTLVRLTRGAAALLLFSLPGVPQEAQPAFEVASIRRDASAQIGPQYRMYPGFTVKRATLKDLLTMAYGIHDFQVSGGPAWIHSDRYDIEAKTEGAPVFTPEYRSLLLRKLQTLLADRFHLRIHHETKELPIYQLTVAKGGPKLQPPNCIARQPGDLSGPAPGKTMMDYCGFGGITASGEYQASSGSTADLAGMLSLLLSRSVVDKTGIPGRFRMVLNYTPDVSTISFPDAAGPGAPPAAAPPSELGPNIFTALQEQLGLRLESAKGPVEVLVIDDVGKPSEN